MPVHPFSHIINQRRWGCRRRLRLHGLRRQDRHARRRCRHRRRPHERHRRSRIDEHQREPPQALQRERPPPALRQGPRRPPGQRVGRRGRLAVRQLRQHARFRHVQQPAAQPEPVLARVCRQPERPTVGDNATLAVVRPRLGAVPGGTLLDALAAHPRIAIPDRRDGWDAVHPIACRGHAVRATDAQPVLALPPDADSRVRDRRRERVRAAAGGRTAASWAAAEGVERAETREQWKPERGPALGKEGRLMGGTAVAGLVYEAEDVELGLRRVWASREGTGIGCRIYCIVRSAVGRDEILVSTSHPSFVRDGRLVDGARNRVPSCHTLWPGCDADVAVG